MKADPRAVAFKLLNRIEQDQAYSGLVLQNEMKRLKLDPVDKRLVYKLTYGVISQRIALDYVLARYCRKSIAAKLRNLLRVACYQLLFLDRIPDFAAVNEAVELAKKLAGPRVAGFVNGVLRNVIRDRERMFDEIEGNAEHRISITTSHPMWLVEEWSMRWGLDFTKELCEANNVPAPLTLRVNTHVCDLRAFQQALTEAGVDWTVSTWHQDMILVRSGDTPPELPGFKEGWFIVQGEAASVPARLLDIHPGTAVIDMCSAPGGKAMQMARLAAPAVVTAVDLYKARLELVQENAQRLGINNIRLLQADATRLAIDFEQYDRVLLDAPCSGFGVIRNKPEIKWRRDREDIDALAVLQLQLLKTACKLVKPGGQVIYATCTLIQRENEDVVSALLRDDSNMAPVALEFCGQKSDNGFLTFFPHLHQTEGFFIAKLQRMN